MFFVNFVGLAFCLFLLYVVGSMLTLPQETLEVLLASIYDILQAIISTQDIVYVSAATVVITVLTLWFIQRKRKNSIGIILCASMIGLLAIWMGFKSEGSLLTFALDEYASTIFFRATIALMAFVAFIGSMSVKLLQESDD